MCCISSEGQAASHWWCDGLSDYKESTYCMQPGTREVRREMQRRQRLSESKKIKSELR